MNHHCEALVRVAYGAHGVVEDADGDFHDCLFRRNVGRPCCGDQVIIRRADEETWVVDEVLARTNEFARANQRGERQVVAANLDQVLIVLAPNPAPSRDILDRYLVAVHSLGIEPVIVLNKVDLPLPDTGPGADTFSRLDSYRALGYPVFQLSAHDPEVADKLVPLLQHKTSILVGQSGVGKSSLISAVLPDITIQTGALSRATGKGTHTTTTTIMYDLAEQGRLIDSPGVWEYGLWKVEDSQIAAGFPEFAPLLGQCRFHNCVHITEPGCAIKNAVAQQAIFAWRHSAYVRLVEQNRG